MSGAYYNEFDPGAAAWLRELIRRGLIVVMSSQVPPEYSASGQAGDGMSGKEPIPFEAIPCLRTNAVRQVAHVQAYARPQQLFPLRMTHNILAHLGSAYKISHFDCLEAFYLLPALGKLLPSVAVLGEMFALKAHLTPSCIQQNRATYCFARVQLGIFCRKYGNHGASLALSAHVSSNICLYNGLSSISYGCGCLAFQYRIQHNEAA